ncbi:MAG: hypothetical protein ACP5QT_00745 [Brevinematia bacterium]
MKFVYSALIFLLFFVSHSYSDSEKDGLSLSGYFQSGAGIIHIISNSVVSNTSYAGKSTLRLNFVNNDTGLAKLDGSVDFNILYGKYANLYLESNALRIGEESALSVDIRKLYLVLKADNFDFYIGRQLIKFGEGFVFSPLNPFSTIDLTDVNFTRLGVDGLRLKIPLAIISYFEVVALPKADFTNSDAAGRVGFNLAGWDISFASFYRGKYGYISGGFSFKGDLILGLYGEFAYHYRDETNSFWNTMVGFDYSFLDKLIIRTEYYYHTFSTNDLNILELLNSPVYPFISKNYIMAQLAFSPTLIDSLYLSYLDNLENEAVLLIFSYKRNLYQNVNLTFDIKYSIKDLTGLEIIKFETLYYALQLEVRY